jgi:type I restriction enzyme S subunit
VHNINSGELKSLIIPICNREEQIKIVTEVERGLSLIEGLEDEVVSNLKRADRLRQSILQKSFSGALS